MSLLVHVDASWTRKHSGAGVVVLLDTKALWTTTLRFRCEDSVTAEERAILLAIEALAGRPAVVVSDCLGAIDRIRPPSDTVVRHLGKFHPDHDLAHRLAAWARRGFQGRRPAGRYPFLLDDLSEWVDQGQRVQP